MNIPDHIFWVKILIFFDADPGSGIFLTLDPGWKNSDPGSATLIWSLAGCYECALGQRGKRWGSPGQPFQVFLLNHRKIIKKR
jgi:hypothetical protein